MELNCTNAEKHVTRSWLDPMRPADDGADEERKVEDGAVYILLARTEETRESLHSNYLARLPQSWLILSPLPSSRYYSAVSIPALLLC